MQPIPEAALDIVNDALHEMFRRVVAEGDWIGALFPCNSQDRIELCAALWPIIPDANKPDVLANAVSYGDNPGRMAWWLESVLYDFYDAGIVAFDGDAARAAYAALPDTFTIYRGTVRAEADAKAYGVCWTLSRERAVWFGTQHGRFRNTESPPMVLSATVGKAEISGLLFDRNEQEVLLCPELLDHVSYSTP